ncbi:MAG: metal ABC transporter substrate-binding protein, partial [Anaerolineae bacterium]|nr:metal ABC transporter substrate-binding protein [Anaerolineae bacterium]
MRKQILSLALILVLALPVVVPFAQAQDDPLHVVASFSILADVVAQVGGDAVEVETLIARGSNPHAFEPSAQDVATLSDADLVFVVGINFEEGLLSVLDEAAGDRVVEVSGCVPVRPIVAGGDHEHDGEASHAPDNSEADCEVYQSSLDALFSPMESGEVLGVVGEGVCDDA